MATLRVCNQKRNVTIEEHCRISCLLLPSTSEKTRQGGLVIWRQGRLTGCRYFFSGMKARVWLEYRPNFPPEQAMRRSIRHYSSIHLDPTTPHYPSPCPSPFPSPNPKTL